MGQIWPILSKKIGAIFPAFAPRKTWFSASGMEISHGVRLRTGIRPSMNNLPPISVDQSGNQLPKLKTINRGKGKKLN